MTYQTNPSEMSLRGVKAVYFVQNILIKLFEKDPKIAIPNVNWIEDNAAEEAHILITWRDGLSLKLISNLLRENLPDNSLGGFVRLERSFSEPALKLIQRQIEKDFRSIKNLTDETAGVREIYIIEGGIAPDLIVNPDFEDHPLADDANSYMMSVIESIYIPPKD